MMCVRETSITHNLILYIDSSLLQVNVITFDNTVHVPVSCDSRLLTGNRENIDQLKNFLEQTTHSNSECAFS